MLHYSLKERAYVLIKDKILNLEYPPGSKLAEENLAEEISMSRTPVREAINQLAAEGFVNSIPRKGIFTKQIKSEEIIEIIEIRQALELLAIENCIKNTDEENLKKLEMLINQFEETLNKKRYKKLNELDSLFHLEIAKISKNQKLISYLSDIEDLMRIARAMEKETDSRKKNEQTLLEHKKIFQAIKSKNLIKAQDAVIKNISSMKANLDLY